MASMFIALSKLREVKEGGGYPLITSVLYYLHVFASCSNLYGRKNMMQL